MPSEGKGGLIPAQATTDRPPFTSRSTRVVPPDPSGIMPSMKILLVDGNNLAHRMAHAFDLHVNLTDFTKPFNPDDVMDDSNHFPTGVLHGVLRTLSYVRQTFPDHLMAVVWDGGYTLRTEISLAAVADGLIPEEYKGNRKRRAPDQATINLGMQKEELRKAIGMTNIPQVVVDGEEADDVIASYVRIYRARGDTVMAMTNDHDYYQLLGEGVTILKSDKPMDAQAFTGEYKVSPTKWVDVGGLAGDDSDNIFGVPGWGEPTAISAVLEHGSLEGVMAHHHKTYDHLRAAHPDVSGDELKFLKSLKHPSERIKYPCISEKTPFTGVALAMEAKKLKIPAKALAVLMFEPRAILAKRLKTMNSGIELPDLPVWDRSDIVAYSSFCDRYALNEVKGMAKAICSRQAT